MTTKADYKLMRTSPGDTVTCIHADGFHHPLGFVAVGFPKGPYTGPTVAAAVCAHERHAFYHILDPKLRPEHEPEAVRLALETVIAKKKFEQMMARQ